MADEISDAAALERLYRRYTTTQVRSDGAGASGGAQRRPYLQRLIMRHVPSNKSSKVLELGCGSGELLALLSELGYGDVSGVDASPEQVEEARAAGAPNVRLGSVLDALSDQADGSIDVLIAFDVLEHLGLGQLLTVVEEAHRVLREGGRFIVHVPNGAAILGPAVFYGDLTHQTCFTTRSLLQLFRALDFADVTFEEDYPTVHGAMSLLRWLAWKIVRTMAWVGHLVESGGAGRGAVFSQGILAVAVR